MITFSFTYSAKFRNDQWIATGIHVPATGSISIDETTLTPDQRRIIADVIPLGTLTHSKPFSRSPFNKPSIDDLSAMMIDLRTYDGSDSISSNNDLRGTAIRFDELPTIEQVLSLLPTMAEQYSRATEIAKQRDVEGRQLLKEQEAKVAAESMLKAQLEEQKKAQVRAERERKNAERKAWIAQNGSAHLKKCDEKGYDCTRLYWVERAAVEYPNAILDYNDTAEWKARSGPTEKALDMLDALEATHPNATVEIVWLTSQPSNSPQSNDSEYDFVPCEAIAIDDPVFDFWLVIML